MNDPVNSSRGSGWSWLWSRSTSAPAVTVVLRFAVGATFLSEGVQKFVFPDRLGVGRFAEAGVPAPALLAPVGGVLEMVCGLLILVGLATRAATVPMIVNMLGALVITKIPILWGGSLDQPDAAGFFDFAHEARTDVAMLAGLIVLLVAGAGRWSIDTHLSDRASDRAGAPGDPGERGPAGVGEVADAAAGRNEPRRASGTTTT